MDGEVIEDIYHPSVRAVLLKRHEVLEEQRERDVLYKFTRKHPLELRRWPIFNVLELSFIRQISMVMIIAKNGTIIATRDKMVYALGNNNYEQLGLTDTSNILHPRKLEILCEAPIKKFAYSLELSNAVLLENGKVYLWGNNVVLSSDTSHTFSQLNELTEKYITDIACGIQYFLFLTLGGKVYYWGIDMFWKTDDIDIINNDNSTESDTTNSNLFYMVNNFDEKKVVFIACGAHFNIAITDEDQIYSWGSNIYGQLGLDESVIDDINSSNSYKSTPQKVTGLSNQKIVKVVCGEAHALALTKYGNLYIWGRNNYGQLGTTSTSSFLPFISYPVTLRMKVKILDIAAVYLSNTSVALSSDGHIYVWGCWNNEAIYTPTITQFSNMYDIFLYNVPYMIYNFMPVDTYDRKCKTSSIFGCWSSAFNNSEMSDLIILVEEKPLYVHKAFLIIRSAYFRYMFKYSWAGENFSVIKHKKFSYDVYKGYLKYLYFGVIDLGVEKILELLDLANAYCEIELVKFCTTSITGRLTESNVIFVYVNAIEQYLKIC